MPKLLAKNFNLSSTLESGQLFLYQKIGEWYYVTAKDNLFKARQEGDYIFFEGADKKFMTDFFSLDERYNKILVSINRDDIIDSAIKENFGMRIIRQDPWECAVSFIISQNSNIPRITKNIKSICEEFGKELNMDDFTSYSFPKNIDIANSKKLHIHRLGYRENFLREFSRKTSADELRRLRDLPFEKALETITELPGIGDKVGQCVMLFSLGHRSAFPVDVWIEKAMKQLYNLDPKLSAKHIQALGRAYFGEHAGYAQQFLYHYSRNNKHLFTAQKTTADERNNRAKAKQSI
ncbi:MAG: hypothetical protein EPN86_03945 [Nanoarchaeota archaeon]|nr:MAG: hypothetical protein EPN86_03945 [Nanoarchaeota archaeon]